MPSGQHLVSVRKELYAPVENELVTVEDGKATKTQFELGKDFGTLAVETTPAGASVLVDGTDRGAAPLTLRLAPGNYAVRLEKDGYRPRDFNVTLARLQELTIAGAQATLEQKLGTLTVYADPPTPDAKVFLDGVEKGTAPLTIENVPAGEREVKIEAGEFGGAALARVEDRQANSITVELRNQGTWTDPTTDLTWQVSPPEANMSVDEAISYCANLELGGYRDWRLPTISELRSLIRGCPNTEENLKKKDGFDRSHMNRILGISDGTCGITDSCLREDRCSNKGCAGCPGARGPGPGGVHWPPELSGKCCWYQSSSKKEGVNYSFSWLVHFGKASVADNITIFEKSRARCVRR